MFRTCSEKTVKCRRQQRPPHSTEGHAGGLEAAWQHSAKHSDGWAQTP